MLFMKPDLIYDVVQIRNFGLVAHVKQLDGFANLVKKRRRLEKNIKPYRSGILSRGESG
jgi:hypothetical protein